MDSIQIKKSLLNASGVFPSWSVLLSGFQTLQTVKEAVCRSDKRSCK